MYRLVPAFFLVLIACLSVSAQKVSGKLLFDKGKAITINMELTSTIAQQAGNQAIDFATEGAAVHSYTVTNTTDNNTSLKHAVGRLWFRFEGMGQKRSFDSDNAKDRQGQFGKQFDEIFSKKFDMIIDTTGKTLMTIPQKIELTQQDERLIIIASMLKDLTSVIYPPKKGTGSFFKVMPGYEVGVGDSWTDTSSTEGETSASSYTLSAITDSTLAVDFKTLAVSVIRSEIMGRQVATNLTNTITGKIILDKVTGIIREKTSITNSSGTAEAMGTSLPINGKTTIHILVKQE
jgi:hypothetical protein